MVNVYKEPTPKQASDIHGELISQAREAEELRREVEFYNKLAAFETFDEADHFLQEVDGSIFDDNGRTREDLPFDWVDFVYSESFNDSESNKRTFNAASEKLKEKKEALIKVAGYSDDATLEKSIAEYADRYEDKLQQAALALVALDGVPLNHPDAIIKKQ